MPKYKSPATLQSRLNRSLQKHLERPSKPPPNQRAIQKANLISLYGLPMDSKFLFFRKGRSYGKPRFSLTYGTVVCLDYDTSELLLVVRFVEKGSVSEEIYNAYNHSISTIYQHAKARGEVKNNGATYRARRLGRKYGRMFAAGFRPGYDTEVKGGHYTWNATTANDLWKMEADLKRQGNLPAIESFFAERFSGLSLYAFESNAALASRTNAPSWASESFYVDLDSSDGVVEMLWNSQVHHHTSRSKTYNALKEQVQPESAEITRFGCSCQISQALVNRLEKVKIQQEAMSESEGQAYQARVLTGYAEQAHLKMKKLAIKLGIWRNDF
ncbi:uncharacterized protein MELLADRAFT_61756 [Melampsora larici-populina 98AG31]|uniref:Tet-like 2OG-Fe(II) oxygenase domain-containing protein n=1 Tax=Melampsora larici-populina (strain 98AG31 / pathotype 3-4-7) TaxID=747676 RepID=F4RG06_MELLP|nr:uncharacterized protein MELLADRAFT_61756 [Melampsora larici-populina 98AG31]EGG08672.1 hypothetical protein MELLADRAFT_61756 [Melampsora larici-populina 98AG31]